MILRENGTLILRLYFQPYTASHHLAVTRKILERVVMVDAHGIEKGGRH